MIHASVIGSSGGGARGRAAGGFTYVELATVMLIIAILAAIAVPNFLEARTRAGVSRSRADLAMLKMAIEEYRLETRAYPLNRTPGVAGPNDLACLTSPVAYISRLTIDPFTLAEVIGTKNGPGLPPEPFRYLNGVQVNEEDGLRIIEDATPYGGYVAAAVWGYAPADMPPNRNPTGEPILGPDGAVRIIPYDPTNGTVSAGTIYSILP
jgi:type II secretory pathway pseudopilin PulG